MCRISDGTSKNWLTFNLQRDPHISPEQTRPFAFDHFGQLWLADYLHGPKLFNGKKKQKTYLHVILDDSTRFIVHGGFYLTESVEPLIYDLMGAVRRFGIPSPMQVITMVLFVKIESSPEIDINAELPKTRIRLVVTSAGYILKSFIKLVGFVRFG